MPASTIARRYRDHVTLFAGLAAAAVLAGGSPIPAAPPRGEAPTLAVTAPGSLAQAARFRRPGAEEMKQFYAEFWRKGWRNTIIPSLPTEYGTQSGSAEAAGSRDGQPEWVVGCYLSPEALAEEAPAGPGVRPAGLAAGEPDDDRARLVIFKRDASGLWRVHWRSPGLGYEFRVPRFNLWEVRNQLDQPAGLRPPIALVDIDADGSLEISYHCWSEVEAVGGLPGVYRFDGARWVSIAPQADRFSLRDVDGDRKLEVITGSPYVGFGSGDDDVPRVWRWNGRQYQEASSEFRQYYRDLAARYDAYIRRMEARREEFKKPMWERALQKAASLAG
jgi:hypothetical protein